MFAAFTGGKQNKQDKKMEKKRYIAPTVAVFSCETADSLLVQASNPETTDGSGGKESGPDGGGDGDKSELNGKATSFNLWDDEEDY